MHIEKQLGTGPYEYVINGQKLEVTTYTSAEFQTVVSAVLDKRRKREKKVQTQI